MKCAVCGKEFPIGTSYMYMENHDQVCMDEGERVKHMLQHMPTIDIAKVLEFHQGANERFREGGFSALTQDDLDNLLGYHEAYASKLVFDEEDAEYERLHPPGVIVSA